MTFTKGSLGAAALYYAGLGWPVFPLVPGEKIPLLSKKHGGRGVLDATTDVKQVTAWWTAHPEANIGLATGRDSDLYVVDVDGDAGEESLQRYGTLPVVPESSTGKGRHLVFSLPGGTNTAGKLGPKIDTRGEGGYIVAPPSLHPSGRRYRWTVPPHKAAVLPLPAPLVDALSKVAGSIAGAPEARTSAIEVVMHGVAEGGRNQALTEYVGRLFAKGLRELEVLELARGVNATKFRPPLEGAEVEAVVNSVASAHLRNHTARVLVVETDTPQPMAPVGFETFESMLDKAQQPVDAMPTMWPTWNKACRMYGGGQGLARGWHVVVAGGAGVGKSLVALNLTVAALLGGHSVGWVSLEMSKEQLLMRMLGIMTGRRLAEMEPGQFFNAGTFSAAAAETIERMHMAGSRLWMAERPSRSLLDVDRLMRDAVDAGCRLVVLDYLQLVHVADTPKMDDAMRRVSAACQSLAFRHQVNTLALSQFNRTTTQNKDGAKPTIYGLMGGSSLENDADQIVLLDHTTKQRTPEGVTYDALLEKNRHGEAGLTIPLLMDTKTLQLRERAAMVLSGPPAWYEREGA